MARTEPGRLYRRLPSIPRPLFRVYFDGTEYENDDSISAITITRGSDRPFGVTPSTIELEVPRSWFADRLNGTSIAVVLAPSAQVAALGGTAVPGGWIYNRFRGRTSILRITDRGPRRRARSVLLGSSWIAQEATSTHTADLSSSYRIDQAIQALLYRSPDYYAWSILGGTPADRLAEYTPAASYADTIRSLTEDYRILVTQLRSGGAQLRTLDQQYLRAEDRITTTPHLTRSQALTPAQFEQPNSENARIFRYLYSLGDGTFTSADRYDDDSIEPDAETEIRDWRHIVPATGLGTHFEYAMRGISYENSTRVYRMPSITVDLLYLLSSGNPYHRAQGVNLLALEVGDTINLGGDWRSAFGGVHVVSGMTERITGNEWSMDLTLTPSLWVWGHRWTEIPAQTWDAHAGTWDSETRTWEETA